MDEGHAHEQWHNGQEHNPIFSVYLLRPNIPADNPEKNGSDGIDGTPLYTQSVGTVQAIEVFGGYLERRSSGHTQLIIRIGLSCRNSLGSGASAANRRSISISPS